MQNYSQSKLKFDPNLDKLIKSHVNLLNLFEAHPSEGLGLLPNEISEAITPNTEQIKGGFLKETKKFFEFTYESGVTEDNAGLEFFELIQSLGNKVAVLGRCEKMVESIPQEESRNYYNRELKAFMEYQYPVDLLDFKDKTARHYFSVVFSIALRYLFEKIDHDNTLNLTSNELRDSKSISAMGTLLQTFSNSFSQIAFKSSLEELLSQIKDGDDKAIFKAITIDKNLLHNSYITERINKAQVTGDSKFFQKLGKAVSSTPLKSTELHGKLYHVLKIFWRTGLYKLSNKELHPYMESCGLIPPAYPYGFNKFMQIYRPHFEG